MVEGRKRPFKLEVPGARESISVSMDAAPDEQLVKGRREAGR
jgi:hypothetical protein